MPSLWLYVLLVSSFVIPRAQSPGCSLDSAEVDWLVQALAGWDRASDRYLRLPPSPTPWIVAYDPGCTWHIAADSVRLGKAVRVASAIRLSDRSLAVWSQRHDGRISLPAGGDVQAVPRMYAAFADSLDRPYFVLALPSVFRQDSAAARDPRLESRLMSVVSHELVHTRQLPDVRRRITELSGRYELPANLDDDIIQRLFAGDTGFRRAFEAERDLLWEAVFVADSIRSRELGFRAVSMIRWRRNRYFTGNTEFYSILEDVFLNMEGVAEWTRLKIHEEKGTFGNVQDIVAFLRGSDNSWSQDEGLALILLLDRHAQDWQSRVLAAGMASPVDELERTLRNRS